MFVEYRMERGFRVWWRDGISKDNQPVTETLEVIGYTGICFRAMGSTGNRQGGGSRVYKGKKMPGRMGGDRTTTQNLTVLINYL